jgi:2-phosphosulfolactate phosphatase
VKRLAPISDAIIIVDVMSFSTCVSVVVDRGGIVYPYRWRDFSSAEFARARGAHVAGSRGSKGYSLSPESLRSIAPGTSLVLPSPNGSTLTLLSGDTPTYAGCLRNAKSVAQAAGTHGRRIAVIPAGERWKDDHSLRPAYEDLVGAGAIIACLHGRRSPEAQMAVDAFTAARAELLERLTSCASGRELIEGGYERDIRMIADLDADECAPLLIAEAYRRAGATPAA